MTNSILIVEDNPELRDIFSQHISTDPRLQLAGSAGSVAEAKAFLDCNSPKAMLVDLGLPDGSGIELITYARKVVPQCESMVITIYGDESHVMKALEAGAAGYLLKDGISNGICDQVCQLLEGGSPINPIIARAILHRFIDHDNKPKSDTCQLTRAEHEVLSMLARGHSRKEIAAVRSTSIHTVSGQIKEIYRKLEARSCTDAVHRARQSGILSN